MTESQRIPYTRNLGVRRDLELWKHFKDLSFLYVSHGVVMSCCSSDILFSWGSIGKKGSNSFIGSRKTLLVVLFSPYTSADNQNFQS